MSEHILLAVAVYLWLVGGIFLAIATAQANFKGIPRKNIGALVLLWPLITLYAAVLVAGEDVVRRVRMWRAR
jgi:hypothetical protein